MLTFAHLQTAAARLAGIAHRTPVVTSQTLDQLTGARVFLKAENLQRSGAFKFRGAFNAINALHEAERSRGVVAFSSGNHGLAVALAARLHGCAATIFLPNDVPALKLEAARGYGAEVILYDRHQDDRAAMAERMAAKHGAKLIPPYDDLQVMAGAGTAALELLEDAGALDALIVCAGGGGFLASSAVAARHMQPAMAVYGAEPLHGNDLQRSLEQGRIVKIDVPPTICDGQQTQAVGALPFEVIRQHAAGVLTASDAMVLNAMRFAFERLKLVLEPSGACGLAALLAHAKQFEGQRVGVMLSGGNIGVERFVALMTGVESAAA